MSEAADTSTTRRTTTQPVRISAAIAALQAERLELLGPVARQIGKTREGDPAGQAIVGDGLNQTRGEKSQRQQHCGRSNGAFLPLRNFGNVEDPPRDKLVEPASGLGDAGKQLGPGVRPRRSPVGMSALDRRDEFAADARGRLAPGNDHGRFSNDRRSLSRKRDLDRTVLGGQS